MTNHPRQSQKKIRAEITDGGADENNQEIRGSPARSVPREVDLHIRVGGDEDGMAGDSVSDRKDSVVSDLGEVVLLMGGGGGSGDSV